MDVSYKGFRIRVDDVHGCFVERARDGLVVFDTCDMGEVASTIRGAVQWIKGRLDDHLSGHDNSWFSA